MIHVLRIFISHNRYIRVGQAPPFLSLNGHVQLMFAGVVLQLSNAVANSGKGSHRAPYSAIFI